MATMVRPVRLNVREPAEGEDGTQLAREVHVLVKDLMEPSARYYWTDLGLSAGLGWGALVLAASSGAPWVIAVAIALSALGLYRAALFIHELTHVRSGTLPGFYWGWNALIGVPLLLPAFLYDGVHQLHHAKTKYGTLEDPEYIFIKRRSVWTTSFLIGHAILLPSVLLLRFGLGTPLGLLFPSLGIFLRERASSLATNPDFRRKAPKDADRTRWLVLEWACAVWSWTVVALAATGVITWRTFAIALGVASLVALVNQVRTLAAHHWDNEEGHEMTLAGQLLDSVNCPETVWINELWAPVGLRFHALHHLMPGLPYHNLPKAHARLLGVLPPETIYRKTIWASLTELLAKVSQPKAKAAA